MYTAWLQNPQFAGARLLHDAELPTVMRITSVSLGKCTGACSDKRLSFEMPLSTDSL